MQSFKTTFSKLSEFQNYVDREIGVSPWYVITQEAINTFAKVTGDEQWIHTDLERSQKESPYGTTIAHGFFVLSLASKFAFECYEIEGIKMGINYGLDRVRFPNATPVDARLRGKIKLLDYKEIPNGAQVKMELTFEIEGQEKPACVAEWIGRFYQ